MGDYLLYKHQTPSGKIYIGITSNTIERRCGRGSGYSHNEYFTRAIKKYGWDNISHEILCVGLTAEEAEEKERQFIRTYQSNNKDFGYNLTDGGEKGKRHSTSSIDKMRAAKRGKYAGEANPRFGKQCSPETRKKISDALKGKMSGANNPNYGKVMSVEQREKIRQSRIGRHYPVLSEAMKKSHACQEIHEHQKVKVNQYAKDGTFIKSWPSAGDAAEALLGNHKGQSNICSCANGNIKSAYGFVWRHTMNKENAE